MDQDLSFYDEQPCVFPQKGNTQGQNHILPSQNMKLVLYSRYLCQQQIFTLLTLSLDVGWGGSVLDRESEPYTAKYFSVGANWTTAL